MSFEELINQYIKENNYTEVISLLHKNIKILLTQILKQYNPKFQYSTIDLLVENAALYCPFDLFCFIKSYQQLIYQECSQEYEIEMLIEIYNRLKKLAI